MPNGYQTGIKERRLGAGSGSILPAHIELVPTLARPGLFGD